MDYANQSLADFNAGDYQGGYKNAESGLSSNEQCSDDNRALVNKGYLLGRKALNEHHLSTGDSRVDINQAITLLAECQGTPGLYGTQVGAKCQAEEEALISYKINWEMENY